MQAKTIRIKLTTAQRQKQVLKMRLAGLSYPKIGERLGIAPSTAYRAVARALKKIEAKTAESAQELRRLELERLDQLQAGLWTYALAGNVQAVRETLRVMERRSKLLGLDAAAEQERTVAEVLAALVSERRAELQARDEDGDGGDDGDG